MNAACRHACGDVVPAADRPVPGACTEEEAAGPAEEGALTEAAPLAVEPQAHAHGDFPLGDAEFERLLALESGDDPEMETRELTKGVTVSKKKIEGTAIYLGKASGVVNAPASVIMRLLWDFEVRRKWDSYFVEQVVLEQHTGAQEYVYFTGKTPPLVSKRDFVQARALRVTPARDLFYSAYVSMEHPAMPPRKGFIRGHVFFSGFVVRKVSETECRVSMITHTDFKGMIPAWVINQMVSIVAVSWVENLRKAAAKFTPLLEHDWPRFPSA
eukprot:GAFH01002256.1.p1 GENE.GAFH01002256.1~~GAFH01002256.1.p1  ORF type:complete len:271 (+),score=86.24 GAFH01002256.1:125-937(+)